MLPTAADFSRMQHGFAARNGLVAALLARANYTGIERVFEQAYGGFISTFTGDASSAKFEEAETIFATLGKDWEIHNVLIKPYPLMAGLHTSVDCIKHLQQTHMDKMQDLRAMKNIEIEMGEAAFKHGGWKMEVDCLQVTGAQMNAAYAVAVQLVDGDITPSTFSLHNLKRSELFDLIHRTRCVHRPEFDRSLKTKITVTFKDESRLSKVLELPRGVQPRLSDKEIIAKWDLGAGRLVKEQRSENIKNSIMMIEKCNNLRTLLSALIEHVDCILD